MMKHIIYLLLVVAGLSSCAPHAVLVRFKNNSAETFTRMDGYVLGKPFSFDSLQCGQVTKAVAVPEAYYYCYMRVTTKVDTLHFRPVDYVGEKLYSHGKLTIEVRIDSARNRKGHLVRFIAMDAARGRVFRRIRQAVRP